MVSPIITKQMRLSISANGLVYTLAAVEMVDFQILREGGVEHRYGLRGIQSDNRHKVGMKRAKFTIRRFFKTDPNQGQVLFNIHDNSIEFILREYVKDSSGFTGLVMNGCVSYNYRLVTGTANDIISEEIFGEGTVWEKQTFHIPTGECLSWLENNSDYDNYTWLDSLTIRAGQRITISGKTICRVYFKLQMLGIGDAWYALATIRRVSDDSVIETSPTILLDESFPQGGIWYWMPFTFNSYVDEEVRILIEFHRVNGGILLWNTNPSISGSHTRYTSGVYTDDSNHDAGIKIYTKDL